MKFESDKLIDDLVIRTKQVLEYTSGLTTLPLTELNQKVNDDTWSILECIEHVNRYGRFYNVEINERIQASKHENKLIFKSGFLGNYFANSMLPKEKLNKMKTFKSMNPSGSHLTMECVEEFIAIQKTMLQLLEAARKTDLTKTKTSITISNMIKLRIGDTFRLVIYHNQRHMEQIKRIRERI